MSNIKDKEKMEETKGEISPKPSSSSVTNTEASKVTELNLNTWEKLKRMFFSKEEWDAYLIEKLEEERKCKESSNDDHGNKKNSFNLDGKKSVDAWMKAVFPSEEDANFFLKTQIDKLQLKRMASTNYCYRKPQEKKRKHCPVQTHAFLIAYNSEQHLELHLRQPLTNREI